MHLKPENVLADDSGGRNRQRILTELANQPGLCFRELVRATGLSSGTLAYHVAVLQRWNLLTTVHHGTKILHFAETAPEEPGRVCRALVRGLDPTWRAVYDYVSAHPGKRQREILDALPGQSRSSAQHRLQRLVEMGLLKKRKVGLRGVAYVSSRLYGPGADHATSL